MILLRNTFLMLFLLSFWACKEKEIFVLPMNEAKLVDVLCDVHIAEAAMKNLPEFQDSLGAAYYEQIYKIHKIDGDVFRETMELIRKRPAELRRIYTKVSETITIKEKEISAKKKRDKTKKDSTDVIKKMEEKDG